jgi:Skp family chaperone for outer membrane proteins
MKTRLSLFVLVALVALMAASGASARQSACVNAKQRVAVHSLMKKANKSTARWSHRALL